MKKPPKKKGVNEKVSVKIDSEIVERVKNERLNSYMPIGTFFEQAALEKLSHEKKLSAERV